MRFGSLTVTNHVGAQGIPAVQYAQGRDGLIAYQTVGDSPTDLVHIGAWSQTVEGYLGAPDGRAVLSPTRIVCACRAR
jgi:hypothetical protein